MSLRQELSSDRLSNQAGKLLSQVLKKKKDLSSEELNTVRQGLPYMKQFKDNPVLRRNVMKYLKLSYPDANEQSDPLSNKYDEWLGGKNYKQEIAPERSLQGLRPQRQHWNEFVNELEPNYRAGNPNTLARVLNNPPQPITTENKPPPMPEMLNQAGYNIPVTTPPPNKDWVFTGSDKDFTTGWQRVGDPITKENIGEAAYNRLGGEEGATFKPEHHGTYLNTGRPIGMSQQEAHIQRMASQGISPPQFDESGNFIRSQPKEYSEALGDWRIQQAESNPQNMLPTTQQVQENQGWLQNNLRQMKQPAPQSNVQTLAQIRRGPSLSGPQAATGRLGEQALGEAGAMEGAALGAEGAAAAGGAGMLGSAAMMASRAVPILNLVMLGGMLMKQMKGNDQAKQQELMYRN